MCLDSDLDLLSGLVNLNLLDKQSDSSCFVFKIYGNNRSALRNVRVKQRFIIHVRDIYIPYKFDDELLSKAVFITPIRFDLLAILRTLL